MNLSPKEKLFLKHFGRGVFFYFLVGSIIFFSLDAQFKKKYSLRNSGAEAIAHVTSTECSNHGKINYDFSFGGNANIGSSNGCNLTCKNIKAGDALEIKFLPDQPNVNDCEFHLNEVDSPSGLLLGLLAFTFLNFLFVSIGYMRDVEKMNAKSPARKSENNTAGEIVNRK